MGGAVGEKRKRWEDMIGQGRNAGFDFLRGLLVSSLTGEKMYICRLRTVVRIKDLYRYIYIPSNKAIG